MKAGKIERRFSTLQINLILETRGVFFGHRNHHPRHRLNPDHVILDGLDAGDVFGRHDGDRIPISRFEGGGMSETSIRVSHWKAYVRAHCAFLRSSKLANVG
jgi:hypothetical protein